jgi:hypothetical protein
MQKPLTDDRADEADQAIRGELIDPLLTSRAGRSTPFLDLISVAGRWGLVHVQASYCGRKGRQERLDCSQQVVQGYRFSDIGIASALQAFPLILGRCKGRYGNDRNGLALIILLKQTGRVEPGDVRQSNIHQDQIRLLIASDVDRLQTL